MKRLIQKHPFVVAAFVLAVVLSVFFAGRIAYRAVYWAQHREEPVAAWMTVGYIGRSWGFDPRDIDQRAGLPEPERGKPKTLEQIARDRGVPVSEVIGLVEETLAQMTAERDAGRTPGK